MNSKCVNSNLLLIFKNKLILFVTFLTKRIIHYSVQLRSTTTWFCLDSISQHNFKDLQRVIIKAPLCGGHLHPRSRSF